MAEYELIFKQWKKLNVPVLIHKLFLSDGECAQLVV